VNLEKTAHISSSGLRMRLARLRDPGRTGGGMALCSLRDEVSRVFLLAGVHEIFPIYVGLDEILAASDPGRENESP